MRQDTAPETDDRQDENNHIPAFGTIEDGLCPVCGYHTDRLTEHRVEGWKYAYGPIDIRFCPDCCPGGCDLTGEH